MIRLPLLCTLLLLAHDAAGQPQALAHRDHVHGMTKRGAAARTSFWSRGR